MIRGTELRFLPPEQPLALPQRAVLLRALELADEAALAIVESYCISCAGSARLELAGTNGQSVRELAQADDIIVEAVEYLCERGLASLSRDWEGWQYVILYPERLNQEIR